MLFILAALLVGLGIIVGGKRPGQAAKLFGWICYTLAALLVVLAIFG